MKSWPVKAGLLAGAALIAAIPALSQDAPESLLPPGFGDNQNLPPPVEKAAPAPNRPAPPAVSPATDALPTQETGTEEGD
jgi:hypothetical protein